MRRHVLTVVLIGGVAALVVLSITGPDTAPPLVVLAMGVAIIAFPHATPETVRLHGPERARGMARALGVLLAALGVFLVLLELL